MDAEIRGDKYNVELSITGVDGYDEPTRIQIAQEAIDIILDRTAANRSVNGRPLKGYNKDYVDSAEFERYGKSRSDVNMELTGSMLDDLNILKSTEDEIVLGFKDSTNQKKAANHNLGITLPKREFLGLNGKELAQIQRKFEQRAPTREEEVDVESAAAITQSRQARRTIGDILETFSLVASQNTQTPQTFILSDLLGEDF